MSIKLIPNSLRPGDVAAPKPLDKVPEGRGGTESVAVKADAYAGANGGNAALGNFAAAGGQAAAGTFKPHETPTVTGRPLDGAVLERLERQIVGQADAIAKLSAAWASGARKIEIVGPPGSGKSILARALAEELSTNVLRLNGGDQRDPMAFSMALNALHPAEHFAGYVGADRLQEGRNERRKDLVLLIDEKDRLSPEQQALVDKLVDAPQNAGVVKAVLSTSHTGDVEKPSVIAFKSLSPQDKADVAMKVYARHAHELARDLQTSTAASVRVRLADDLEASIIAVAPHNDVRGLLRAPALAQADRDTIAALGPNDHVVITLKGDTSASPFQIVPVIQ